MFVAALAGSGDTPSLERAARDLGAPVAELLFDETDGHKHMPKVARHLGQMYDAVDCGILTPQIVEVVLAHSGIPTYAGLGLDTHPAKALGDLLSLCDHQDPSAVRSTIRFRGDRGTTRSRAFLAAATEVGFVVSIDGHVPPISNGPLVDATDPSCWALHASSTPVDEAHRSANHRFVIQTILLDTITKV